VLRRLGRLEQTFKTALFDRRRSGYIPTEAGERLIDLSRRIEDDILQVARQVSSATETISGVIRLATSDSLLEAFFPIVREFQNLYPGVRVEACVANDPVNLARSECDIAIRATNAPAENLYGRKLATIAWAPYKRLAPDLGPVDAFAMHDHDWVSYSGGLSALRASALLDQTVAPERIVYRADSVSQVATAIRSGIGAGYLPCMSGDILPDVCRIGDAQAELSDDLWLLTHPDIRASDRVSAFMRYFSESVARMRPLIEGMGP
jgi:DNA-binding transcriptional LysR family regulator